jgi:hypothetical protein
MTSSKNIHPEIIIYEHFDDVIRAIDLSFEELTIVKNDKTKLTMEDIRETQIILVKAIRSSHLTSITPTSIINFFKTWQFLIDDYSIAYEEKLSFIKASIIQTDCVIVNNASVLTQSQLWIIPTFLKTFELNFFK